MEQAKQPLEKTRLGVKDLRNQYPTLDILLFCRIIEEYAEDRELMELALEEAEYKAVEEFASFNSLLEEVYKRIVVGETHRNFDITVPDRVDREHVQAILVYGYMMPGRGNSVFAGSKCLPDHKVRLNVRNKLMNRFVENEYIKGVSFLVGSGVILPVANSGKDPASSLNIHENDTRVTAIGRQIITKAKQFLFHS